MPAQRVAAKNDPLFLQGADGANGAGPSSGTQEIPVLHNTGHPAEQENGEQFSSNPQHIFPGTFTALFQGKFPAKFQGYFRA